jgi:GT2 family glycosyltransferase
MNTNSYTPCECVARAEADVSVIIVNYNVCCLLEQCLCSLYSSSQDVLCEVIVIDNASTDGSCTMVASKFPRVCLIRNEKNTGFAKATNAGIKRATGQKVLLLNPDTIVKPLTLESLSRFLDTTVDAGVVGPKLLNGDGSLQKSCRSFPSILGTLVFAFLRAEWLPESEGLPNIVAGRWKHNCQACVDYVIGAAFMMKANAIKKVGLLDEGFFLYGEEKDWCYRAREAGYRTYYVPTVEVIHLGGQSSGRVRVFALAELYKSLEYFVRKHYRRFEAGIIILILRLSLLLKSCCFWTVSCLPGGQRRFLREKARGCAAVLKCLMVEQSDSQS